jgi:hypothetical protein
VAGKDINEGGSPDMIGKPSVTKRRKEQARAERQRQKAQRRLEKKDAPRTVTGNGGEDPDIAGIVPGPQPIPLDEE